MRPIWVGDLWHSLEGVVMRLVDGLVCALSDWQVRRVFGVSGANIEHFHDAINRLGGSSLRSVMG